MDFVPAPDLGFFLEVRVQTRDPLSDRANAVEDLQGEVSACPRAGDLPLRTDPGEIAVRPGAADLLVAIPDPLEAVFVQRAQGGKAVLKEAAGDLCHRIFPPIGKSSGEAPGSIPTFTP